MNLQRLKLLRSTVYEEMHLQENTLFFKVTQNVVQYPLHQVTYALVKFEVAIQGNTLFDFELDLIVSHETLLITVYTACDL